MCHTDKSAMFSQHMSVQIKLYSQRMEKAKSFTFIFTKSVKGHDKLFDSCEEHPLKITLEMKSMRFGLVSIKIHHASSMVDLAENRHVDFFTAKD